ncbi:glycoside hydrolase family 16 protein [Mucilaginibacter daejeonensis]|uniref:glycoside hydrolase family 16 protein n=1 Tax=Mucilaginibacter daejeonensis TaxID=398049 RepID=UPI001D1780C5|nr:glycoside hydrolase family 16 protein [Mucilaginibacter daejeonensis]UEG51669.1 glycoside hydrolase family 16 protein [Mucilaginibacter daejeonensis]
MTLKQQLFTTLIALIAPIYLSAQTVKPDTAGGYRLVWADEFDRNGMPDSTNWGYERGFERNEELQWYQPDNAWCENGRLIIEARRETKANPRYEANNTEWRKNRKEANYTSSSLRTRGKRSWQYGRFVMRGKIDISNGMWPAWWTLGVKGHWPATGEIDIMEYYRKKVLANMVCLGPEYKDEWYSRTRNIDSLGGERWASQFHIWRMDWSEKAVALYVDDMLMISVETDKLVNKDGTGINPFKQPHYMLLNLAIGGQQGGDPSKTKFPKRFEIDYVRVYQKKGE